MRRATEKRAAAPSDVEPHVAADPAADRSPTRHLALVIIATGVVIVLLQFMQPILIPFVLSGLLFYALDAPVDLLEKARVPRAIGALVVLGAFVAGICVLVLVLHDQAMTVIDKMPEGARRLARIIEGAPADVGALDKVQQAAEAIEKSTDTKAAPGVVRVQVEEPRFSATTYLWTSSRGAVLALNQVVMVLFLTYFMLLSDQLFKRKLVEVAGPTLSKKKVTVQILEQIAGRIEKFLMVQILTSALVALVTWLVLWWLGLEQAALWGLMAGVLNSIPYYGPLIVTSALGIVGYLQFGDLGRTASVAGAALLITALEGFFLTPLLMGKAAEMNRVAVFAGLLFWSWVWGIWGLLLAVPMMMVVKVVCDHVEDLQPVGHLLGE